MADLLRSGSTMLNIACPVCNNPIFRKRDRTVFCPTCNRKVLIVRNNSLQNNEIKTNEIQNNKKQQLNKRIQHNEKFSLLKEVLIEKIELIIQKLKNEDQINLIEQYTNILAKCIDILSSITFQREKN
ncbi:MAG: Sjogren's syndrome/scleroderma autoantigen 1 family protein [Promethearchaeota archaeon]